LISLMMWWESLWLDSIVYVYSIVDVYVFPLELIGLIDRYLSGLMGLCPLDVFLMSIIEIIDVYLPL